MVAADLKIGGFNGDWGSGAAIERKRALLVKEGVTFTDDGRRISEASLYRFAETEEAVRQPKRKRA